jgi:hypothetical protein
MSNKSSGNRYYDSALVIQSRPEIDTNEFGLMEATFSFLTAVSNWPSIQPARGTPCHEFNGAFSEGTITFLLGVSFLACQTARWKPGPLSTPSRPGTLEVLCQGAIFFNVNETLLRISDIPVTDKGAGYDTPPTVNLSGGGQILAANVVTRLEASTRQVNSGGTGYIAGDVLTVSGGSFVTPAKLLVDTAGTGGSIKVADGGLTHFMDHGSYSVIPGLTAVALTGGTGTGATVDLTWRINDVFIISGGAYTGTPTASLSGGTPSAAGSLGTVIMGTGVGEDADITTPFSPVSLTKETLTFTSYATATSNADLTARLVAISDLGPCVYYTQSSGVIRLDAAYPAIIPDIDGVAPSEGDLILLTAMANPAYNGLYKLLQRGTVGLVGEPWEMARVVAMDEANEVTTQVYVHVNDGVGNANTRWHCTSSITTLGTDPIIFAVTTASATIAGQQITIEYSAIDLHFEYMSKTRVAQPRFIQDEYTIDGDGLITIDPLTGDKLLLPIDSSIAQSAILDPDTGITTIDAIIYSIDESVWRPLVRYKGTASRFDQTPAGAVWHVLETTTIKIDPILPA